MNKTTHKIRKKTNILTFEPWFEEELLRAHPWASSTLISSLLGFTGARFDFSQMTRMNEKWKMHPEFNYQKKHFQHMQLKWISDGFRLLDEGSEESLKILDDAARKILKND